MGVSYATDLRFTIGRRIRVNV